MCDSLSCGSSTCDLSAGDDTPESMLELGNEVSVAMALVEHGLTCEVNDNSN